MTDRELLELAAKAAGIELDDYFGEPVTRRPFSDEYESWNPLTDDGDALRLAVKLNLSIDTNRFNLSAGWCEELAAVDDIEEPHVGDPCAATRRAIVRAAAEIGKDQ